MEYERHRDRSGLVPNETEFEPSQILVEFRDELKKTWEKLVREQIPASQGETSIVLLNSLDIFLDEMTLALGQNLAHPEQVALKGMSKLHGQERAAISGYFLPQLLEEFSILRQVINEMFHRYGRLTYDVKSFVDKTIDTALSLSATEFAIAHQQQIKAALMKAEINNRDLEQFALIAAHDLKAPLATISGYLNLLVEESGISPASQGGEYAKIIEKTAARMRSLIDRLLEYARFTKIERPFQLTDLNDVVNRTLQNLSALIVQTKSKITYDKLPIVMGDVDLLTQVFQNLLSNAIKFHGQEAPVIHISVESNKVQGSWSIKVSDNGIGFDPKKKEEIFTLYRTLHSEGKYQGAGIGLATCRKVIELHGGHIWAESAPGKGSCFFFTLPKILGKGG